MSPRRYSLSTQIGKWTAALDTRKFMGGDSPNLADIALFGVLRAVKGFDTYRDVLEHTELRPWLERMEKAVGPSSRIQESCAV